jgi:type I restriction enzyme R subunit
MKPSEKHRLDERNHVEKPLQDQLSGLGWEIIDLTEEKQTPEQVITGCAALPRKW